MRRLLGVTAVLTAALALAAPAFGAPVTKTLNFPLQGNSTTTIFTKSFECCNIDVDSLGVHSSINGGVDLSMKATMNEATHNDVTFTDTNLRQGRTLDLTNTLSNPSGTLAVNYMFSGHLSLYGIGFDINKDEGASMSCGLPLPSGNCSKDTNVEVFSFKPIDILVGYVKVSLNAVISTHAALADTGLTSHRTLTIDSTTDVKPPTDLTFISVPQSLDESVNLSCELPANANVNYAMGDESSAVTGTITEGLGVNVSAQGFLFDPIPFAPRYPGHPSPLVRPAGSRQPATADDEHGQPVGPWPERRSGNPAAEQRRAHRGDGHDPGERRRGDARSSSRSRALARAAA